MFRHADRSLAAQYGRCEHVGRDDKANISGAMHAGIQICHQTYGDLANLVILRKGYLAAPGYIGLIIDIRQRPSRLLRSGSKAAEEAGDPETHAAFVGKRTLWD